MHLLSNILFISKINYQKYNVTRILGFSTYGLQLINTVSIRNVFPFVKQLIQIQFSYACTQSKEVWELLAIEEGIVIQKLHLNYVVFKISII